MERLIRVSDMCWMVSCVSHRHPLRPTALVGGFHNSPRRGRNPGFGSMRAECATRLIDLHSARFVAGIVNGEHAVTGKLRARLALASEHLLARRALDQDRIGVMKTTVIEIFNNDLEAAVRRDYRTGGFIAHRHSALQAVSMWL